MIALCCFLLPLLFFTSCASTKRYQPVVRYRQPSQTALSHMLAGTKGKRYRYAAQGPNRFDCSGLTYYSFGSMNLWLPRKAIDQAKRGQAVSVNELQYGDLIFFDTGKPYRGKVNHVGIYVGNGKFTHASSSKRRVITSSIHKPFYRNRIIICKRLIPSKTEVKSRSSVLVDKTVNKKEFTMAKMRTESTIESISFSESKEVASSGSMTSNKNNEDLF